MRIKPPSLAPAVSWTGHKRESKSKFNKFRQLLGGRVADEPLVAHLHHRHGGDSFADQNLRLESRINFFECEIHLFLQGFQALQHDGTKRTTEKTIKGNRDASPVYLGRKFVADAPVAKKTRDAGEIAEQCPPD